MIDVNSFFDKQLAAWPKARGNFDALSGVKTKTVGQARVQFNPARIASTGAKVDAASIKKRACFLCEANRPAEQFGIDWGDYTVLVNPFPIFPRHLTIPCKSHVDQRIAGRVGDMCRLAAELPGYVVFYNGPRCGASAPDHMHFQAGNADFLPAEVPSQIGCFKLTGATPEEVEKQFADLYASLPAAGDEEPMMNVLCRYEDGRYILTVIPRKRHRPSFYGDGEGQMLVSPASVDLAGVLITPREKDFNEIDEQAIERIYKELCYSPEELAIALPRKRMLKVGILSDTKIEMHLDGDYLLDGDVVTGEVVLEARHVQKPMIFVPLQQECRAEVKGVTIGVNFHWERQENQRFVGRILIVPQDGELTLINVLPVEDYLASVISSEMSATSQIELLKAHAVISRSWALAQIEAKSGLATPPGLVEDAEPMRIVKWYGGNDHDIFDVCADDHCQRYQGVGRQTSDAVTEAVKATEGEVLVHDGKLCDARFSKCCGGVFEEYENCWEPEHKDYLVGDRDWTDGEHPDLSIEENAREWILSAPEAFCNTSDREILSQVLNGYDQETTDFYRWVVEYGREELSELVSRKSGIDFGLITDLIPLERGTSGRISMLRVVGEKCTADVDKELEIRRWLSESHLYSSAFVVEKTDGGFRLCGAGWGHGVGLCQIGAAMMAARGYDYRQILSHYYPGALIEKR